MAISEHAVDKLRPDGRPHQLRIRISATERRAFGLAANLVGLELSSWARMVLREAVLANARYMPDDLIAQMREPL